MVGLMIDKRIDKIEDLQENEIYSIDNDIYLLIIKAKNRFVFSGQFGTYIVNKIMLEDHLKAGVYLMKNS